MLDLAAQVVREAEEAIGLLDVAGDDQTANVRRGDDLPVGLHELGNAHVKTAALAQQRDVTLGPMAEAEVLPDRHLRRAELPDEHIVDERVRRLGRELGIERDHHELLDAEPGDDVLLDRQRCDQLRRGIRRDHGTRVRLEGEDRVGVADNRTVAEMHAVELADGDVAWARLRVG